jgi:hypothetical protein
MNELDILSLALWNHGHRNVNMKQAARTRQGVRAGPKMKTPSDVKLGRRRACSKKKPMS